MPTRTTTLRIAQALTASAVLCFAAAATPCGDWPTYLHDIQRSGVSTDNLDPPLSPDWTFSPAHPPSPAWGDPPGVPVETVLELPRLRFDDAFHVAVAGGGAFFGSSSDHKVYALDVASGAILWEFFTEGPVRLAPTAWGGKVYAGSDDGKVYCLDGASGQVVWTFAAAPGPRRVLGNGKMISLWPVRTGVLVDGGVAYFGAGLFPAEGLFLYAVDAETGKLLWKNDSCGKGGNVTLSPQGYLLASKDKLFVPSGRAMPAAFSRKDGEFLFHRNLNWRDVGLFGGTQFTLAGDLLIGGTEQVIGISEKKGDLVFVEGLPASVPSTGARRVAVDGDVLHLLSGKEALAVSSKEWFLVKKMGRLRKLLSDLKDQFKSNQAMMAYANRIQAQLDQAIADQAQLHDPTRWKAECACSDSLALTRGTAYAGGPDGVVGLDRRTGKQVWSAKVSGRARGLAVAGGRLFVSTDQGNIHCFVSGALGRDLKVGPRAAVALERKAATEGTEAPEAKVAPEETAESFPPEGPAELSAKTAEAILAEGGPRRGFALILGDGARLGLELARRTELMVYASEPDASRASEARKALSALGVHGARVSVDLLRLEALPYSDYFANLIVCRGGTVPAPPAELLRLLKPCGGVALLGGPQSAVDSTSKAGLPSLAEWTAALRSEIERRGETGTRIEQGSQWTRITRGALPGAGNWTHQYAEPGNTACGDDRLVRGALGLLWFGEPGPTRMPSRHASGASPLVVDGRAFIQGEDVILAHDIYNGLLLWERKLPGARRYGLKSGGSNLAATQGSLFVAIGEECHRLDADTGKTVSTFTSPQEKERAEGEKEKEKEKSIVPWSYVACAGGLLYGCRGTSTVFVHDIETGALRWTYSGENIQPTTISLGDGKVFFVERSATAEEEKQATEGITHETRLDRRGKTIPPDVRRVVALDARTGELKWKRPQYVSDCVQVGSAGGELTAMYAKDVLLLCGQPWNGHFWPEFFKGEFSRRSLIALSGKDGYHLWSGRKGYRSRPLIVGDTIIAEPWAHDLRTGAEVLRAHPVTGAESGWQMARPGHHCGNIVACPGELLFRSGYVAYYDLEADEGTVHFGGIRPGCWVNCIPAGGLVIMPEASSGCVCPFSIQCTIAFQPREESRPWGMYSATGPLLPVRHLAVNLGAPGDRKDSKGTLWLAHPRPYGGKTAEERRLVLDLPLEVEIQKGGGYSEAGSDFLEIEGTDRPWIFASSCAGLTRCAIPIAEEEGTAGDYTVRLYFAELDDTQPGQRVFSVEIGGRVFLEGLDIVREAGGPRRALVKEITGLELKETLEVKLKPLAGKPSICGIEIVAEGPRRASKKP